jgi:hypothetical protein
MGRNKVLEICRNLKKTLDKKIKTRCTTFSNPMFDKPIVKISILKKQLKKLIDKYNVKEEEL